jgi:hypothetical protein
MNSASTQATSVRAFVRRLAASSFIKGAAGHCLLIVLFYSLLFTLFFSPVLFHHALLAPGDGLLYHEAFFQSKKILWDTLLSCGFPMTADPQVMAWYPPSLILSLVPGWWNVFVVSAYVMASCFAYGYVYTLTESRLSGLVSGIIYGMCGFMMAQLGHTAIIHAAVWMPLIIWSLEMLRRKVSRIWFVIGSLAIACCVLAGHLQIVAYSLLLGAAYAIFMGWSAPIGRRRFYLNSLLLLILGIGLAAIQLLPTAELATLSTRADYSFADFVSYSLPINHVLLLLFPAVFGGSQHYGIADYFGQWNLTELTGYVGLLPLMLAAIGVAVFRRQRVVIFWLCAAVLAFLLALGDQTPLARLIYHLPVIGKFRAPARHVIEMTLAVSVLAGMGVAAILRRMATKRLILLIISLLAALMAVGMFNLLTSGEIHQYALEKGVAHLDMRPWSNLAVAVPLIIFLIAGAVLFYWYKTPTSRLSRTLLLSILILDLGSFGWFYSWQDAAPSKDVLLQPVSARGYKDVLQANLQRMVSVRGTRGAEDELPPNLSRVWDIPNATNYSPLSLSRIGSLLNMLPDGGVAPTWRENQDQGLNLAAVRYVYLPRTESTEDAHGISWQTENMDIWLGAGCDHPPANSVKFNLSEHFQATKLGIVTRLACSVSIKDDEEVARVLITDIAGHIETHSLLAGRDTSEWSYDCHSIKPQMQHRRADIFSTFPAKMYEESCEGHYYLTTLKLDGAKEISQIEFQWTGHTGALTVEKVSLINELGKSFDPISPLAASNRWRLAGETDDVRIYENLQARPRAWLASETVTLKPEEMLSAIKTSRLPDGRAYDPARMALLEEPVSMPAQNADASDSAQVTQLTETTMEVQTTTQLPALLITSDTFYPGWHAFLDGMEVPLYRVDYALRGVEIPSGRHLVRFSFRPKTFYFGAAISIFSILILAAILLLPIFTRQRVKTGIIELTAC